MDLVIGNHHLSSVGGAETYLLTIAEQLGRLGHRVTIYGSDEGDFASFLRSRRLEVAIGVDALPGSCDAVIAQDAVSSLELAARFPSAPQVFVSHAGHLEMWFPPNLPEVVSCVIVMNDRVGRRLEALATRHEIVRLRQPVDIGRFSPRERVRDRPRRILALGNYLIGTRRDLLLGAAQKLGIELIQVGRHGRFTFEPEAVMRDCDIVVGHGRSLLEGMACGLAAYVYDLCGSDGWVTPATYQRFEADGFAGSALNDVVDTERLVDDLARGRPQMGLDNRELIRSNHNAIDHAAELARLTRRLVPRPAGNGGAHTELARLARSQWYAQGMAAQLRVENQVLRQELNEAKAAAQEAHSAALRAHADLEEFKRTRRYRLARLQARPLDALRGAVRTARARPRAGP